MALRYWPQTCPSWTRRQYCCKASWVGGPVDQPPISCEGLLTTFVRVCGFTRTVIHSYTNFSRSGKPLRPFTSANGVKTAGYFWSVGRWLISFSIEGRNNITASKQRGKLEVLLVSPNLPNIVNIVLSSSRFENSYTGAEILPRNFEIELSVTIMWCWPVPIDSHSPSKLGIVSA